MRLDKIEKTCDEILHELKDNDERLNAHILEDAENFHSLDKKLDRMTLIGIFLFLIAATALGLKAYEIFWMV